MVFSRIAQRMTSPAAAVLLVIGMVTAGIAVRAPAAFAAGTVLYNQPFHNHAVDGPVGSASLPTAPTGTNGACLSAAGNTTKPPIASCTSSTDPQGQGKLRFTSATTSQEGGVFNNTSVPTSQGLDATFNSYQYGGTGGDGIAFVLAAVNPANPVVPATIGQPGGALGYSAANSNTNGLSFGYLGVGFDASGSFSNRSEGSGCTDPANISSLMPGQVVVRGPGNGTVGYCALQSSAATASSPPLALRASTRTASLVPVEVVFNPTSSSVTTASGLVVPAGDYNVTFTPVGGTAKSLVGALPVVPSGLYPSSWVTSSGIPKQLVFGWVASTGGSTDFHEIDNVLVSSINPVPQLAVSQTSYTASTLTPGSPVTYTVAASSSGATENQPVTVTETLPAGVLPVGASGPGWVCGAPSGQQISCTSSTSPFTSGTITVNGVVNSSSVTQVLVQSSTSAVASSSDASPATSSSAPAGTVPAAPAITAISPTNGAAGGANDVKITGTGLDAATAIEIGTAAEFAAGTPTTLNLCAASGPGCFTVVSGTSLDISAMPAHMAAAVTVKVVTLGTASSTTYTYNAGPALLFPAPPGGEVGVTYSDQLTVTGGTSPFTWSVSSGSLPPGVTLGASTGLLSGTPTTAGTYSFTVKVTDNSGLTSTEAATVTIIPGPSMTFAAPPGGWTNTVYGYTLTESGGTSPFTWSVSSGSLPAGISLSPDGNLSGTPTATGTSSFTVKVTDANGQSATQATSIAVSAGVSTTFSAPPAAAVNAPYSVTLTATGGTTPYTWSVNAGTLPPGLTLSSAGVLSGTPTTTGTYPFTVNVVDANQGIATASITLVVTAALILTFPAPPSGTVGTAYTDTLTAAGGTTPYTFSISAGTLPAGLTLNASTGVVSGTPTTAGTSSFTVKVTDARSATATFATSITILSSMLTVAVSASTATAAPGGTVTYTITATNSGQVALTGATFTDALSDVLDDASYNGDASATAGSVSFASPNLTWTGNLAVGAAATITFSVTVNNPDTGNKTLASKVTSTTTTSNCASGSIDTRCSSTVGVSILTIAMTATPASTTPGSVVSYTITVTNSGTAAYTGAALTDSLSGVLDDAIYNSDGATTAGSLTFAGSNLSWTGNLAAGASATITFSVTVNNPDTGNKVLASTITSATAGSNCASGSSDARCASSVTVLVPGLTMVVSAGSATTTPGSVVQYTVTVTNSGQTPYTGASFTDPLSGLLDDASYNSDAAATSGTVSFASSTVTWTGNLAVGASATVTFSVTVKNPDTGDKTLVDTITSATAGSNCPVSSTDARCSSTVTVLVPGLQIAVSAGTSTTTPGSVVHYTVTVTNSGQTAYTGATFTEPLFGVLDDAAYNSDAAATAGSVSFASPNLTWTGNLAVGASATVTFSVTVNNPDTGNKILASTITSTTTGSNCAAGSGDPPCTATVPVAMLTITTSSSVSTVTPGGVVRFTTVFVNSGQVPYTGITIASNISDVRDDATPNGDQTATSGTITLTTTGISWTGSIPVGGTVTITGSVTVNDPDTGNKVLVNNFATTAAGSNCPSGSADPRCSVSVTVLIPELTIVKSADVSTTSPGGVVHYTVTITDSGPTPYTGATYTDQLDGVLGDATYNGDAAATVGSVSFASPDITWTGNLAAGASATVTYSVTVNDPDTGNRTLTNTVVSATPGNNCPAGGTDPRCTVTVRDLVPSLDIVIRADKATATPGAVVHYTITVTNTGPTAYTGASFTDPLSGVLDDVAYNGDATATAGSVSFASPNLTWTGNLAVGAAATITFSVTVNNPETGDRTLTTTVTSATVGNNCPVSGGTDPDCTVTVTVVNATTLTFTATADKAAAAAGGVVHYTITVANSGLTPYTGATFTAGLGGVLDDAAYDHDAAATAGTVTFTSPSLTWTGDVPASGTVTITYSVTVNSPDTGNQILASTITSASIGSNCGTGSADPRCTATVDVAALRITATADTSTTSPGSDVEYTVTATNTGQASYSDTSITLHLADTFEDATYNGDLAATSGTITIDTATQTGTWTGDLAPGATVTITYSVVVLPPDTDVNDTTLTLTVDSAALGNNCPVGGTDPACTAAVPVLVHALTITKTANTSATTPGATVTYTITVADTGQTPYTGATVTDSLDGVLDDAAYNHDAAASAGTLSYASPDLTWTGNLTVGQTVTITYSVTVHNPDTGGKLLVNFVTSTDTGSTCPFDSPNPGCTVTIAVLTPALTIVSTASPATTAPGHQVTYTITVTDTGQTPYTGATVANDLTGLLDDAVYNHDATATRGAVSYASPVLTWTGNLTPGQAATITYSVTVDNPDTGDDILTDTVTSAASGSNCPVSGGTDPRCTSTVPVATLTIVNTANVSTTTPGSTIRYTFTVTDTGQTSYDGATVTDPLTGVTDDAVAFGNDATTTTGSVDYTSPDLTWTGDLAPGQAATITFTVTVDNPDTGDKIIASTLTSTAAGSTCPPSGPAPACTATVTVLIPALIITKTATTSTTTPGATVGYTITVTDTGQTPYTAATVKDSLDGVLHDALYNNDATATSGTLSYTSPDLTWTGDLTPGQAATITYTVTVDNPDTGDKHLVNFVTSTDPGSTCPSDSPAPDCTATVTDLIPALTITKTATTTATTPGSTVGYTVTVDDTGQTPYTAATVTDNLGGVLDDAAYNHDATATSGTVSYASPVLTWTGDLTPGATATITYAVTVNDPDTGSATLSNTAVSTVPGSTCPTGTSSPGCSVTVAVVAGPLSITVPATANLGSAVPGGTLSAALGTVQITDDRGFGASWTATVSATGFATGNGTPAETIPAADAQYIISALGTTTGSATFTPVPTTQLSASPQAVVNATNVAGNTTVTWDPTIHVNIPGSAIGGGYAATITHSVS
jgi:large repetitive protein